MNAMPSAIPPRRRCRGASLPLVTGLGLVLVVVGSGLLATSGAGRTEAVRRQQALQCFWGAESALALVRCRLFGDPAYRAAPSPVTVTGRWVVGEATVTVSANVYTVQARGTNPASRLSRRVRQQFRVQRYDYWDDFALLVGGQGLDLAQSVAIYGDVYSIGSVRMSQSAAIFETLYCLGSLQMSQSAAIYDQAFIGGSINLGGSSVIYGGSYPFSSPANPYYAVQPEVPTFDWTWYESLLAQAAVQDSGLDFNNNVDLSNQVRFVRGSAALRQMKSLTSTPPGGVLVVRDMFEIQQQCWIGPGVTVVCGDRFWMGQNTQVHSNAIIYARNRIEMKQSGIVATGASLVTPGTIDMKQAAQATGFVYAGTLLDLSQGIQIRGLCYAGQRALLSQSVTISYAPSALPFTLPPGLQTNQAVVITPSDWREL